MTLDGCARAGVLSLLECVRHLSAPDCNGPSLLLQTVSGGGAQQQQQQRGFASAGQQMGPQGVLQALLRLLNERHIAALQVGLAGVVAVLYKLFVV